jgi:hypothetical protein
MEENSRRSFFKKAAAAVGVVAAAGATKSLISSTVKPNDNAKEKYAADIAAQQKAVTGNTLILMSDAEKNKRLEELLSCHYQEIA